MATTGLSSDDRYRAITAKDARFDGQFITAVSSTRIYCRPSCPALTPKRENVAFYPTSAAAHEAGYRACKRCLPDAAPGDPTWNLRGDVAARAMRLIADGTVEREGVTGLAARLGYSSRHLSRVLRAELGAGPLALARAQRARTAATLLSSTSLPLADVAFAAGFSSVRQFNDTVQEVFELTPTLLRTKYGRAEAPAGGEISLALPHRAPFDSSAVFTWLSQRAIEGVEVVGGSSYRRTLRLPGGPASFSVEAGTGASDGLRLRATLTTMRDLQTLVARVRRLFDLDADPQAVDAALAAHPAIADRVRARPGLRLPGAVDPEEMLFRAIVGQQITVSAARMQLSRLTELAGEDLPDGTRLFPTPAAIAELGDAAFSGPRARAATLVAAAGALADGSLQLTHGDDAVQQHAAFTAFKGIGDWTAGYVSMRVLGNPDVLLTGDVALRSGAAALGLPSEPKALTAFAEPFRPWRSYLSLHLWGATPPRGGKKPPDTKDTL